MIEHVHCAHMFTCLRVGGRMVISLEALPVPRVAQSRHKLSSKSNPPNWPLWIQLTLLLFVFCSTLKYNKPMDNSTWWYSTLHLRWHQLQALHRSAQFVKRKCIGWNSSLLITRCTTNLASDVTTARVPSRWDQTLDHAFKFSLLWSMLHLNFHSYISHLVFLFFSSFGLMMIFYASFWPLGADDFDHMVTFIRIWGHLFKECLLENLFYF